MIFGTALSTESLFAELAIAGVVVILAGSRFTRLADTLGERLNIASGWIGLLLLASVTSLPELVTGGTATYLGNFDLAVGAIFGSCCFNITLIVLLNAMRGGGSVLRGVSTSHTLTSSFGLALIGLALIGLVLIQKFSANVAAAESIELAWCALIAVTYFGCMKLTYRHERAIQQAGPPAGERQHVGASLYLSIALVAIILVIASWWLARTGDTLSTHPIKMIGRPLGATFVGVCFLALATSLPEIATSVAAVRLGNMNLALGNIFGSNMFNIFVFPFLKIVSLARGDAVMSIPKSGGSSTENLIAGLLAILLTTIAVAGLAYQTKRKLLGRFGFDSLLIAATYLGGLLVLFANVG